MKPSIDNYPVIEDAVIRFYNTLESEEQKDAFEYLIKCFIAYIDRVAAGWGQNIKFKYDKDFVMDFRETKDTVGYIVDSNED